MNTRRGMGKGTGKIGYYNLAPMDAHIHSLSAKGVKTYEYFYNRKGDVPAGGVGGYVKAQNMKDAKNKLKKRYHLPQKVFMFLEKAKDEDLNAKKIDWDYVESSKTTHRHIIKPSMSKGKLTKKQLLKERTKLLKELRNLENQKEEVEENMIDEKDKPEREYYEDDLDYYENSIEEIDEKLEKNSDELRKVKAK
jgi:hypothetical protein